MDASYIAIRPPGWPARSNWGLMSVILAGQIFSFFTSSSVPFLFPPSTCLAFELDKLLVGIHWVPSSSSFFTVWPHSCTSSHQRLIAVQLGANHRLFSTLVHRQKQHFIVPNMNLLTSPQVMILGCTGVGESDWHCSEMGFLANFS